MAWVSDYKVIVRGQIAVYGSKDIGFEIDSDGGHDCVFQLMHRGLGPHTAAIFVNGRKSSGLLPYSFTTENDWMHWTFVTPPGVVRRRNTITFARDSSGVGDPFFVDNVICHFRQDA